MKPLQGIRVVEFEGIGPGPLAGRFLADMGASVTVITRPTPGAVHQRMDTGVENPLRQGKSVVVLDLKQAADHARAVDMVVASDVLIEGNRPGVMEKLDLGPAVFASSNPQLVYGRMTGWGQSGPLSAAAGHDLNYVALSGILSLSANRGELPILPPTVVGDAVGALGLAFGIVSALHGVKERGEGCVIDGAIVDIVSMLGMLMQWIRAAGQIDGPEPSLFHDSPFYSVYACADGGRITLGAIEPQFYALLLNKLGITNVDPQAQYDRSTWPQLRARFGALFATRPRAHWCELLEGTDVCFAPVLSVAEAAVHPHNVARGTFKMLDTGAIEVTPAPRLTPLVGQIYAGAPR